MESEKYVNRIDHLKKLPPDVNKFIMMEPLLSPMPKLDFSGINWVVVGGESNKKERFRPINEEWVGCHRMYLVCHHIRGEFEIMHILADGTLENNHKAERRMMEDLKIPLKIPDVLTFEEIDDPIERAYVEMGKKSASNHPKK